MDLMRPLNISILTAWVRESEREIEWVGCMHLNEASQFLKDSTRNMMRPEIVVCTFGAVAGDISPIYLRFE